MNTIEHMIRESLLFYFCQDAQDLAIRQLQFALSSRDLLLESYVVVRLLASLSDAR